MIENPYEPPKTAKILETINYDNLIDDKILKNIKGAWIIGIISALITLIITILSVTGNNVGEYNVYNFIDVAILGGLTFGIYKKSRACATIMVCYYLASKILQYIELKKPSGIIIAVIFLVFYIKGMFGTYQYRKEVRRILNTKHENEISGKMDDGLTTGTS